MNNFSHRSALTELIDEANIPFKDWHICLQELNIINTWLGGHAITIRGVKALINHASSYITIAEIGCGGGDNLKAIHQWNKNKKRPLHYIGIDLNKACIDFVKINCSEILHADFIRADYRDIEFKDKKPDIIFSSLFCHHFTNEQLIEMLIWLTKNAEYGFFINDLQRHPVAYYAIKILTSIFSRSYLIKNDAPVSVLRSFKRKEWKQLLQKANIKNYKIKWQWAFRYLIIVKNEIECGFL